MKKRILLIFLSATCLLLIPACSSNVPETIKTPITQSPDLGRVHANPESFLSSKVRWGGTILQTDNLNVGSRVIIVAHTLKDNGEPVLSDNSPGRFIAVIKDFLEPTVYTKDRLLTVTGNITGHELIKVGDYPYQYPVVTVDQYYLWPVKPKLDDDDYPPYWWDPWYYPYPYYPYHPYYPHTHPRR